MDVSKNLKQHYAKMYDDPIVEWRTMGARCKAQNILELSKTINFKNVLEVGAGEGSILYWLSKWNFSQNLYGIEISQSGIDITKSKDIEHLKEVLLFDGYKIPYPDNHFDLVICSHVMEHVEHERILLREIKRVSKYQIFEIPIDFSFYVDKRISHFLSYGHINIYTPALFRFLLLSERFDIVTDKCLIYSDKVWRLLCKSKLKYYKFKIKHFILRLFPYLLGIKPNSYIILTTKNDKEISIFEQGCAVNAGGLLL